MSTAPCIKADPDSAFFSQLLQKVAPSSTDLQNFNSHHFNPDTFPFTPANGSPAADLGYDHWLQNPYAYGSLIILR